MPDFFWGMVKFSTAQMSSLTLLSAVVLISCFTEMIEAIRVFTHHPTKYIILLVPVRTLSFVSIITGGEGLFSCLKLFFLHVLWILPSDTIPETSFFAEVSSLSLGSTFLSELTLLLCHVNMLLSSKMKIKFLQSSFPSLASIFSCWPLPLK